MHYLYDLVGPLIFTLQTYAVPAVVTLILTVLMRMDFYWVYFLDTFNESSLPSEIAGEDWKSSRSIQYVKAHVAALQPLCYQPCRNSAAVNTASLGGLALRFDQ